MGLGMIFWKYEKERGCYCRWKFEISGPLVSLWETPHTASVTMQNDITVPEINEFIVFVNPIGIESEQYSDWIGNTATTINGNMKCHGGMTIGLLTALQCSICQGVCGSLTSRRHSWAPTEDPLNINVVWSHVNPDRDSSHGFWYSDHRLAIPPASH